MEHVPGAWAATWLLQVMPAFFMVGGYANCAAWTSARRRGDGTFDFLRRRFHRLLVHQLGYLWADGTLRRLSSRQTAGLAGLGLLGLIGLTALDVYPRSLVATTETEISHLSPPTVVIAVAALFQLGTILLFAPRLARMLQRRRPWMAVIAANAVILTIFLWHMTALLLSIYVFEGFGGTLGDDPTVSWWLTRPLWIVGPAVVLAPLVAVFAPFEVGLSRSRGNHPGAAPRR